MRLVVPVPGDASRRKGWRFRRIAAVENTRSKSALPGNLRWRPNPCGPLRMPSPEPTQDGWPARGWSGAETLAPFGAPAGENGTPMTGRHASPETVGPLTLQIAGLERALHGLDSSIQLTAVRQVTARSRGRVSDRPEKSRDSNDGLLGCQFSGLLERLRGAKDIRMYLKDLLWLFVGGTAAVDSRPRAAGYGRGRMMAACG